MKGLFFSIFLFILLFQVSSSDVFAPFISSLRTESEGNTIKLTWKDAPDNVEGYFIYRSHSFIDQESFVSAEKIASLSTRRESYIDHPPSTDPYFYAVLAFNQRGELYRLFIPYRNITVQATAVMTLESPEDTFTEITNLRVAAAEGSTRLSFQSSDPRRELVIFRSVEPIDGVQALSAAVLLDSISSSRSTYQDQPLPGISYYYAIFDSEAVEKGIFSFSADENFTARGIELPLPQTRLLRIARARPLPFLILSSSITTGDVLVPSLQTTLPARAVISRPVMEKVKLLTSSLPPEPAYEAAPYIFPEERGATEGTDAYRLGNIISETFSDSAWEEAEKLLANFMSVRRASEIEYRAHFYRGQVYFHLERYQEAFMEFILAEEKYYVETQPWLNELFSRMRVSY